MTSSVETTPAEVGGAPDATSVGERLSALVAKRAATLQAEYRADRSSAVAMLALLRRGVSQHPGHDVRLIEVTIAGVYPATKSLSDEPLKGELAAHAAMTLFALHQQSHRTASMHRPGYSFGRSARLLGKSSGARDAVRHRFTAVATASSWDETLHHTRGLIQQFRSAGIPLDYGQFARDLLALQYPESADRVRLTWGRDFYRERHPEDDGDATSDDNAADDSSAASPAVN